MLDWKKPTGLVILVYLTEHEDNMAAVWACLLAGYIHKDSHVAHIKNLISSAIWLTTEVGAEQVNSISGLEIHLLSELKGSRQYRQARRRGNPILDFWLDWLL
jgi:hypothetical protein